MRQALFILHLALFCTVWQADCVKVRQKGSRNDSILPLHRPKAAAAALWELDGCTEEGERVLVLHIVFFQP